MTKPPDFELEDEILRRAVAKAMGEQLRVIADFLEVTENLRPFIYENEPPEGVEFQRVIQDLNKTVRRALV